MDPELRVHSRTLRRHARGGPLPLREPLTPERILFQKRHASAYHIDLRRDAEAPLEFLDPLIVSVLNHQGFTHIYKYISKYTSTISAEATVQPSGRCRASTPN